ncbi:MAG: hypothetical protein IPI67_19505 [Myxococcales bacterium]|nr:hypothetical protein [Myxococcales bacterium]
MRAQLVGRRLQPSRRLAHRAQVLALALATAVAVSLAVTFYTLGQTKIHQASAIIQFDPNPPRPLGKSVDMVVDLGTGTYWNNREYYETQYKIIQSMRVALPVVQQLGLQDDASFIGNKAQGALPGRTIAPEEAAAEICAHVSG